MWNRWSEDALELLRDMSLSRAEVADRLGRSESSVKNKCHELGIDRTFRGRAALQPGSDNPWTEDELALLRNPDLSLGDIARLTGRSYSGVLHKSSRVEQRRRSSGKAPKPVRASENNNWTEQELALLADTSLSLAEVSARTGRTVLTCKVRASRFGIQRYHSWSEDELSLLRDTSLSLVVVAERTGRKLGSVYAEASIRGIARGAVSGESHYKWMGGSNGGRGRDWSQVRLQVLDRDGYTCQDCGLVSFSSSGLHVHHVIPYRLRPVNQPRWLTTLCNPCHAKRPEHRWKRIPDDVLAQLELESAD